MHVVINKLTLSKPVDDALVQKVREFFVTFTKNPEVVDAQLVVVSDTAAVVLVHFTTREALDRISKEVAAPWFAEHVRPYLGGPVERVVGEVVTQARVQAS
jgi:hypothetical protein